MRCWSGVRIFENFPPIRGFEWGRIITKNDYAISLKAAEPKYELRNVDVRFKTESKNEINCSTEALIDIKIFEAHSVRSAITSNEKSASHLTKS